MKNTILPNDMRRKPQREDDAQRRKWDLTREAFDQFLSLLDLDRDRAGEGYETLRRNLIQLFIWRGCRDPEAHADETINRVIRKIDEGEEVRDPIFRNIDAAIFEFDPLRDAERLLSAPVSS